MSSVASVPTHACVLERPRVGDIMFDYKSGKTKEGWAVEQIKGGGILGLVWYGCMYAARKAYPECAPDSSRLGLDPDFVNILWTMFPSFTRAATIIEQVMTILAQGSSFNDRGVILCVAAGLGHFFDPSRRFLVALPSDQQVEMVGGGINALEEMRRIIDERPGKAIHPAEEHALAVLASRLESAKKAIDAGASFGAAAPIAPVLLQRVFYDAARERQYIDGLEAYKEARAAGGGGAGGGGAGALPPPPPVPGPAGGDVFVSAVFPKLWSSPLDMVAAQWTFIEHAMFRSIPNSEWLAFAWDGSRAQHGADGCRRFIDHFNAMALWVTSEVLAQPTPHERAAMIVRFAQLAVHLRRFNNFCGLVEISMGLRRDSVVRLDQTWSLVPAAARSKIMEIHTLVSDAQNYRAYKQVIKATPAGTPLVPHLGAHTAEVTAQEMMLPQELATPAGGRVIHFRRYRELLGTLAPLIAMQDVGYEGAIGRGDMPPIVPSLANLLNSNLRSFYFYFDEDREAAVAELSARSMAVEPYSQTAQVAF